MKIVVDKDIPFVEEFFSTLGEVEKLDGRRITNDALTRADVLIVRSITPVNEKLLANSGVGFVGTVTSGTEHVDLNYLEAHGIGFAGAPGCNARAVAEYVLSSLFVLMDQDGIELNCRTAGIIGCGHAGSQVRDFLQTLGVECLVNDPPLQEQSDKGGFCEMADIFSADIITLHVPLVMDGIFPTFKMVDTKFLSQLKRDVILINSSRGDVIDENALLEFIAEDKPAGVVLDVWQNEPYINTELLSRVDIGTPHIAGYSTDARIRATRTVFCQVCEYFNSRHDSESMKTLFDSEISKLPVLEFDDDNDAIQMSVLASYDVRTDSCALSRMLELNEQEQGTYFDELRSDYRNRREFPAMCVNLPAGSFLLAMKLEKLGFKVMIGS